nr:MAG TPA: upper collar protein [Caudoviricetes sp.]
MRRKKSQNYKFEDSLIVNDATYIDYLNRFRRIALSMFEWVNLPQSMNARFLEQCLYYTGQATLIYDKKYGFINTKCAGSGNINIYGIPNRFNCFSYGYKSMRDLYTGINPLLTDQQKEENKDKECILVMNNVDRLPTAGSMELFAWRLYLAQRTCDVNISGQRFPVMIVGDDKQRLMLENLYNQYNGNQPFIFGNKDQINGDILKAIKTDSPYVVDKITDYKKEIWNEALTYLGINNMSIQKKERLTENESNENNELVNMNLQAMLFPRQQACREFNEKFGLTGTDKEISVRVRSDLKNIIKMEQSIVSDFNDNGIIDKEENINKVKKEVVEDE